MELDGTVSVRTSPPADLAIVLPAYNEEARLEASLTELIRFQDESGLCLQLVIADDGSSDRTLEIARRSSVRSPSLSIETVTIPHAGKGAAVRAGMQEAHAAVVGYCDADLSIGPDAILGAYAEIKDGADMAIASRVVEGSTAGRKPPLHRKAAGHVFNAILRKLTDISLGDTQCGMKLMRDDVAESIFPRQEIDGFAFDIELIMLALRAGYSVVEVPVRWNHVEGSKVSMLRDSMRMTMDAVRLGRRLRAKDPAVAEVPALVAPAS